MDFIGILLTVAGVAVVSLIVAALVSAFYHSQRSRARRKGKLNARQELEAFLLDTTYRRNVFAHLYFPVLVDGTKRTHHYQRVDAVVVTKGGVLVLTVFDKTGRIDNSRDDVWVVIQDDDRTEVESPVISMEKSIYPLYETKDGKNEIKPYWYYDNYLSATRQLMIIMLP